MLMRYREAMLWGAVLATLAACTAPPGPLPSTLPTAQSPGAPQTPSLDPRTGAAIAREGIDYEPLFGVQEQRADGRFDVVRAVSRSGRVLIWRNKPGVPLNPSVLVVKDSEGERELPSGSDGPLRQVSFTNWSPDGHRAAWIESTSTRLDRADWELFSLDGSGEVRHLTSSREFDEPEMPRPPEFMPLAVSDTTAYFTTVLRNPQNPNTTYTALVSAPLSGGKARILVRDAHLPAVGNDGLYYVRDAGISRTTKPGIAEIWFVSPNSQPRLVHTHFLGNLNQQIRDICLAGDKLVWVTGDATEGAHGRVTILSPDGATKSFALLQAGWEPGLTCSDRLIGWAAGSASRGEDTTQYVYSLDTGTKWKVGEEAAGSWIRISGNIVAFFSRTEGRYRIVRWLH